MNAELARQAREHKARQARFGVRMPSQPVVVRPAPRAEDRLVLAKAETSVAAAREIVHRAAEEFGVFVDEIYADQRNPQVLFARYVAIHRLRRCFPHWTHGQLADAVGRTHATVMFALGLLKRKPSILAAVMEAA